MILHIWVSNLNAKGGIQCYSMDCLEALQRIYPQATLRVFSMNDSDSLLASDRIRIHSFGFLPSRLRSILMGVVGFLYTIVDQPAFICSLHPHFLKALKLIRFTGIPVISSIFGIEIWGVQAHADTIANLRHANGLLPITEFTRKELFKRDPQFSIEHCPIVMPTYREHLFQPGPKPGRLLQKFGFSSKDPVLLTVARMSSQEQYKGHDQVLDALPYLLQNHPSIRYVIVGGGDDKERLQTRVQQMNLSDHVFFAGIVPDEELADYYRLADLFVMPSRGEGFGIVFLEALACGTPCIAGNQDASSEAIDGGRLGFLVTPGERDQLVDAIHSYLTGTDGKPWLHEPETLSEEVRRIYGKAAFEKNLKMALEHLFISGI